MVINAYINMLGRDRNITFVGAPETPLEVSAFALLFGRKSLSGLLIGGRAEIQEMLDFCGLAARKGRPVSSSFVDDWSIFRCIL